MSPAFTKPERSLRSEFLSFLAAMLVPFGIMSVFPYKAVGYNFSPKKEVTRSFASLVFLSEEEEREAIRRARSTWQTSNLSEKGVEIDLSLENLPELDTSVTIEDPIVHVSSRSFSSTLSNVPIILPSLAAETPKKVKMAPVENEKFFGDNDLLKLK